MVQSFGLYLILTNPVSGYEKAAQAAVDAGLRYLQLRMKHCADAEILKVARSLREITADSSTKLIINDSVEIAKEVDADGVHLGQSDMSLTEARKIWPAKGKIFGLSTHNKMQEASARELAPDYIGVGPVYQTPTKECPDPTVGLSELGEIIKSTPLTSVAIGGIDGNNLADVLAAGAINFAVVRAVNNSKEPLEAIGHLMDVWRSTQK